ncbi:MAG: hypothetical protein ACRBFS_08620 [Aureispira sp.]
MKKTYLQTLFVLITVTFLSCQKSAPLPRGMVIDWIEVTALPTPVTSNNYSESYIYPTLDVGEVSYAESRLFTSVSTEQTPFSDPTYKLVQPSAVTGKKYLDFEETYTLGFFHQYSSSRVGHSYEHTFIDNFILNPSDLYKNTTSIELEEGDLKLTLKVNWIY